MRYCIDEAAAVAGTAATTRVLDEEQIQDQDQAQKNPHSQSEGPVLAGGRIFGSQRTEGTSASTGAVLEDSPGGPILRGTIPFIGRQ